MSQWEYDTIVNIIQFGAPALANVLINSLQKTLTEYTELKEAKAIQESTEDKPEK